MSADNGIYILRTSEGQNRVIHAQAIDNICWDDELRRDVGEPVSKQLLSFFGNSRYTYDKSIAFEIAENMAKHCPILEYGISTIEVNKSWKQIVKEASETNTALEVKKEKIYGKNKEISTKELADYLLKISSDLSKLACTIDETIKLLAIGLK